MSRQFFTYELPESRIAQYSRGRSGDRSSSRLLVLKSVPAQIGNYELSDHFFSELPDLLRSGDLVVLNNSAVIPCRFFGKMGDGDSRVEVLLLRVVADPELVAAEVGYEALARPMRRAKPGMEIALSPRLRARVLGRTRRGDELRLAIRALDGSGVGATIREDGMMPLPGYIRGGLADEADAKDYQTIYAENPGSVAAPTAGFHFSRELFQRFSERGIATAFVTLHVGPGSFQPVQDPLRHEMPAESYVIPTQTLREIERAKREGRRIVAVGTTTLRALESFAAMPEGPSVGEFQETRLFICPGFRFQTVDVLVTNFHQPRTTHLLLVAAFIGEAAVEKVYAHALSGDYRFLSYGDACLFERMNS